MGANSLKTLFLDIGGVMLTNGWDHKMRSQAVEKFHLDPEEFTRRHTLVYSTHELGKMDLDAYLNDAVFYEPRSFSPDEFKEYMYAQSRPYQEVIAYLKDLKKRSGLKFVAVSNEGRELALHRIHHFGLTEFIDIFVVSAFVHFRKPDLEIFRLALDLSQSAPHEVAYIDDREILVEVGKKVGLRGVHHRSIEETAQILEQMILENKVCQ